MELGDGSGMVRSEGGVKHTIDVLSQKLNIFLAGKSTMNEWMYFPNEKWGDFPAIVM